MGIPDRTVQPMSDEIDVYEAIDNDARKEGMDDMEVFCAWQLGMAAYKQMRELGGKLPSDPSA